LFRVESFSLNLTALYDVGGEDLQDSFVLEGTHVGERLGKLALVPSGLLSIGVSILRSGQLLAAYNAENIAASPNGT